AGTAGDPPAASRREPPVPADNRIAVLARHLDVGDQYVGGSATKWSNPSAADRPTATVAPARRSMAETRLSPSTSSSTTRTRSPSSRAVGATGNSAGTLAGVAVPAAGPSVTLTGSFTVNLAPCPAPRRPAGTAAPARWTG